MVNDLRLKDKELMVYALIYGFSQNGEDWFTGSTQYIANWISVDARNVFSRYIRPLIEKGLIIREDNIINNQIFPRYKAVWNATNNNDEYKSDITSHIESTPLNMRNLPSHSEDLPTLNLRDNNQTDNIDNNLVSVSDTKRSNIDSLGLSKEVSESESFENKVLRKLNDDQYSAFQECLAKVRRGELVSSKDSLLRYFNTLDERGWKDGNGKPIINIVAYVTMNFVSHLKDKQYAEKKLIEEGYEPGSIYNFYCKNQFEENALPKYDTANNAFLSVTEQNEILRLMGKS